MIVFDVSGWQLLQMVVTVLLPVIVGLVTTRATDPALKALLLAALSIITNLLTEMLDAVNAGDPYNLGTALVSGVFSFIVAVGMHYGFYKPTRIADKAADMLVTARADADGRHEA